MQRLSVKCVLIKGVLVLLVWQTSLYWMHMHGWLVCHRQDQRGLTILLILFSDECILSLGKLNVEVFKQNHLPLFTGWSSLWYMTHSYTRMTFPPTCLQFVARFQYGMVCHTGNINTPLLSMYFTDSLSISILLYIVFIYSCVINYFLYTSFHQPDWLYGCIKEIP